MIYISYSIFDISLFKSHFSLNDITYLCVGLLFVISSIICFSYKKTTIAICFLFIGAFILRLLMAVIDPFIHLWDEQFHALVAYNMMSDPFHPMLYKYPLLPYDYQNWTCNHIWLHKQPLFLWQMALSMKLFGVSPFAIRFPSVILSALTIPTIYRMGKIVYNTQTGFIAALLICISNIHVNIVSGFLNTDQNDAVFMCYVTFSLWTWTEYMYSGKKSWLILTGLFSGMAILVKWLIGLLVYAGWSIALIAVKEKRNQPRYWFEMGMSMLITLIIVLPWQLYIHTKWPLESIAETTSNLQHLANNYSHPGAWWYHFSLFADQYGWLFLLLIVCGGYLFIKQKISKYFKWALLFNVIFVYAFFSFVQTRMPFFCIIVSPILFIIAALALEYLFSFISKFLPKYYNLIFIVVMISISFLMLNIDRLEHFHTDKNKGDFYRQARIHNLEVFKQTKKILGSKDYVVFNLPQWNAVSFMFYTGLTAYECFPTAAQYNTLIYKEKLIAVFDDPLLPDYLKDSPNVIKIPFKLTRNGF